MGRATLLLLSFILLGGAGCAKSSDTTTPFTPQQADTPSIADTTDGDTQDTSTTEDSALSAATTGGDISLSAEVKGPGAVSFKWEIPKDTTYEGFILIRGDDADPIHDGKNFWFRQHYTRRAATWTEIPSGDWHFRICATENDECMLYSEDIELSVR